MKLILCFVLFSVIISGVGFAYSQTDSIPAWVKGVAGFWAQDEITDREFIKALEFLIESNIIHVESNIVPVGVLDKIGELEKENLELKQKIKSLESETTKSETMLESETTSESETILESKTTEIIPLQEEYTEPHVTTDKQEYGLGDTIRISGLFSSVDPKIGLDGNPITEDTIYTVGINSEDDEYVKYHQVQRVDYAMAQNVAWSNYEEGDIWVHGIDDPTIINDDNTFTSNFLIDKTYERGQYTISIYDTSSKSNIISAPFTIK